MHTTESKFKQSSQTNLHLSAPMWHALLLRNEGMTYSMILTSLEAQFERGYSISTVKHWFAAGGALEPHLMDLEDRLASEAVEQAIILAKRLSLDAVRTLNDVMSSSKNPSHRL